MVQEKHLPLCRVEVRKLQLPNVRKISTINYALAFCAKVTEQQIVFESCVHVSQHKRLLWKLLGTKNTEKIR